MKVVTKSEYAFMGIVEKKLKDKGTFESVENYFKNKTSLEEKGQAYKGLERKYKVRSANGLDKKIIALEKELEEEKKENEYINYHLANNNIFTIEELSKEIAAYKQRIKKLESLSSKKEVVFEVDHNLKMKLLITEG